MLGGMKEWRILESMKEWGDVRGYDGVKGC